MSDSLPTPASKLLETLRDNKEHTNKAAEISRLCDIASIALSTVYMAAHHGNIRCIAAAQEIENRLLRK